MVYSELGSGRPEAHREGMEQFDRLKFNAMMHYVISRCPPEHLGRTKLNKAAFYADMLCYLQFGRPLTRESYVKQQHGPVAYHLQSSLRSLILEGAVSERLVEHYGFSRYEYKSLREPDTSRLSDEEKALIDEVTDFVCLQHSAKSISEFSHTEAWQSARLGEELPYFAATELLSDAEVDEGDRAWADEELARRDRERPEYREVRGKPLRDVCRELLEAKRRVRA